MYQTVIYSLLAIMVYMFLLSFLGNEYLGFRPIELLVSLCIILIVGLATHTICVKALKAPNNFQSSLISLLILFLIVAPSTKIENLYFIATTAVLTIVLKYLLMARGRHIFNPVAIAIFLIAFLGYFGAEWWIGTRYAAPIVLLAGLFVAIKLRKMQLLLFFVLLSTFLTTLYIVLFGNTPLSREAIAYEIFDNVYRHLFSYPTLFFAFFMLTEPNGFPGTKKEQYVYTTIIALFFSVPFNIAGLIHSTPELALLIGNMYATIRDRKARFTLSFQDKKSVAKDIVEYTFRSTQPIVFTEGQYMEWTLPYEYPDERGIKRVFTISSCTEKDRSTHTISFAIKHLAQQSSFKNSLEHMKVGDTMYAGYLGGDFVLPQETPASIVFLAGGIGITPFVSMLRKKIQDKKHIPYTLIYCCNTKEDVAFRDVLENAQALGLRLIYVFSREDSAALARDSHEYAGYLHKDILLSYIKEPEQSHLFYVSGPSLFVDHTKKVLQESAVPEKAIVTDYFTGLA